MAYFHLFYIGEDSVRGLRRATEMMCDGLGRWSGKETLFSIALPIGEFRQIPLITKLCWMVLKMRRIWQVWKNVWVAGGDFTSLSNNFCHKHICHLSHWQESIIWNQKIYSHEQKINYTVYNSCASLLTELAFLYLGEIRWWSGWVFMVCSTVIQLITSGQ